MVIKLRENPMKLLRVKDNQYKPKEEFSEITEVVNRVADKTLEQLEWEGVFVFPSDIKKSEDLTKGQMILQSFNNQYVTGNVMGFLGVGTQSMVIQSRFSKDENDFFFQYLLERVLEVPNFVNLETSINQEEKVFRLFLCLFPRYLQQAMRKGIFKTYICNWYNDGNARGSIDVARHIRKNTPFVGNIAYSKREYSYDNELTELIRHTIESIKGKPFGNILLNSVKDEVKQVILATPKYKASDRRKIISENQKNVVRHAYYHEYRALQQLCILILRNEKHQYGDGTKNVYGILFDGAWLWEEYVNLLIKDAFYHPKNKAGDGEQYLFEGKNGLGRIYPDFIGKDRRHRVIADAKYKPLNNIKGDDYLQVLAYMLRFDCKQGYYLYPEADGANTLPLRLNQGVSYENNVIVREDIFLVKCGLQIPSGMKSYDEFVEKIKERERIFKEKIIGQNNVEEK